MTNTIWSQELQYKDVNSFEPATLPTAEERDTGKRGIGLAREALRDVVTSPSTVDTRNVVEKRPTSGGPELARAVLRGDVVLTATSLQEPPHFASAEDLRRAGIIVNEVDDTSKPQQLTLNLNS